MIVGNHEVAHQASSPIFKKILASNSINPQERHAQLLLHRSELTETLATGGLQPGLVLERAQTHLELGYADLAAADAYLALTLAETGLDVDHSDLEPVTLVDGEVVPWPTEDDVDAALDLKLASMKLLAACLIELGCLKDAYDFCLRLDESLDDRAEIEQERRRLCNLIHSRYQQTMLKVPRPPPQDDKPNLASVKLPNVGFARREVYPWNTHEPDRSSPAALQELNRRLKAVAPDLEVRSTSLPVLHNPATSPPNNQPSSATSTSTTTCLQLGLFATRPLAPYSAILREYSTLTATRALHASLCDNCCSPLPSLSSLSRPIPCSNCNDAIFCSPTCHSLAQSLYHPILCANDDGVDEIGRDPLSKTPAEDLYFLLVTRALAMAAHQGVHPLDLPEIQYLWGDFVAAAPAAAATELSSPVKTTLPFTFQHSVVLPFRFLSTLALTHPELSPGSPLYLHNYDPWVIATLYAKCRGVASARQSTWDGRPEVAAVHPMWCLANHSCNPNVEWGWGEGKGAARTEGGNGQGGDVRGDLEIVYRVRDKLVWEKPSDAGTTRQGGGRGGDEDGWQGIKAGEEILNHYCDVRLPVQERREWASGALGGHCKCERCVWESQQRGG